MILSVPTLWLVFVINFLALAMVWAYVIRSYPTFRPARYWAAATLLASVGAGISGLRNSAVAPAIPIMIGNPMLIFACCLGAMGVRRFFDRPVRWGLHLAIVAVAAVSLGIFTWNDNMAVRIATSSVSQALSLLLMLPLMFSSDVWREQPGARLTGCISVLMIVVHAARSIGAMLDVSGAVGFVQFNPYQALMVLLLVFLSMAWNFGFLLMAVDRLHGEVTHLAMQDDLTGIANRRHMIQRIGQECATSQENKQPFSILVIDLDGFKAINDRHGHAAGDECLRQFVQTAQSRLRPGDLLARSGGDEFVAVLPDTTQREGAMIARYILEACRAQPSLYDGPSVGVSIGIAQWRLAIGDKVDRLIAMADQALYTAKSQGKDRYAIYEEAPRDLMQALRQSA
jgi:diguanylate cyclase (GGDEF)-like protein